MSYCTVFLEAFSGLGISVQAQENGVIVGRTNHSRGERDTTFLASAELWSEGFRVDSQSDAMKECPACRATFRGVNGLSWFVDAGGEECRLSRCSKDGKIQVECSVPARSLSNAISSRMFVTRGRRRENQYRVKFLNPKEETAATLSQARHTYCSLASYPLPDEVLAVSPVVARHPPVCIGSDEAVRGWQGAQTLV